MCFIAITAILAAIAIIIHLAKESSASKILEQQLSAKILDLTRQIEALQADLAAKVAEIANLALQNEQLQRNIELLNAMIAQLQNAAPARQEQLVALQRLLADTGRKFEEMIALFARLG